PPRILNEWYGLQMLLDLVQDKVISKLHVQISRCSVWKILRENSGSVCVLLRTPPLTST
ncbi:hypothetical protein NPIL_139431, partial [Nephila pilipes]